MFALSPSLEGAYFLDVICLKKFKLFFIRNYQRFIRFFISFSSIGCILVSSFAVGAVTSFTPSVGAPSYFYAVDRDGVVWEGSTSNPGPCKFSFNSSSGVQKSIVGFSGFFIGPSSVIIDVPFSLSIPDDSYFSGSCSFRFYFNYVVSGNYGDVKQHLTRDISVTLFSFDGSSLPLTISNYQGYFDFIIPASSSYEYLRFSFDGLIPSGYSDNRIFNFSLEFKNFDFVYGSSQEFAGSNISAFLDVIGSFFSQAFSFLSSCLAIIVASPALTILCLAMPICSFAVLFLRRFIHT